MNRGEILDTFKDLACSQGFYGRLLEHLDDLLENDPDAFNDVMSDLEKQNFATPLDLILYIEC